MSPALRIAFLLVFFSSQTIAFAQESRLGPVYADKFPTVEVVIETSAQLAPQNVRLLEDGQATATAARIQPFGELKRGLAVVFALDVSGSMAGRPLEQMKRALAGFAKQSSPQDRIAIVTFADDVKVEADFGSSASQLQAAIAALAVRGRITELHKGLVKALQLFDASGLPERRRMIVISDGHDEGTAYTLDDVIAKAKAQEVPVETIGLTRIDPKYLSNLERLADLTGGHYERAQNEDELGRAFNDGLQRLRATPVAVFTAQKLTADGEQHRLGARWNEGGGGRSGERLVSLPKRGRDDSQPESRWWLWTGLAALLLVALLLLARKKAKPQPIRQPQPEPPIAAPIIAQPLPNEVVRDESNDEQPELPRPEPTKRRRPSTQIREEFPAPRPGRPAATLVCEEGLLAGERVPIETDNFTIGGEDDNTLCVADDGYLSGQHAYIRFDHGSLLLTDRGSSNGTFLNGERLAKEKSRLLKPGDRLKVGHSVFVVERGGWGRTLPV